MHPPRVNIPLAKENLHLVISVARDSAAFSLIQLLIAVIIQRFQYNVNSELRIGVQGSAHGIQFMNRGYENYRDKCLELVGIERKCTKHPVVYFLVSSF